jgi:hypothetical protein
MDKIVTVSAARDNFASVIPTLFTREEVALGLERDDHPRRMGWGNVEERRSRLRQQLVESRQRLLDPARSTTTNTWPVGNGPAIRLVPASEDRMQTLVIRVTSVGRAKAFRRDRQLLGVESDGYVAIAPPKVGGLDIRLVEKEQLHQDYTT